jgi:pimeloyl-ACP methyl ester carboxylesterase
MPLAKVNGFEMYYETMGEGPPLVLAHGVGGNHAIWWQQVKYFAQWYQVITFDHRGFALSVDVEGGPGRAAFVDDLEGLLDFLKLDKVSLIAQSMGGRTCLGFAVHSPERVNALVMAATTGFFEATGALAAQQEVTRKATDGLPQAERVLSPSYRERDPVGTELYLKISGFNASTQARLGGATMASVSGPSTAALTEADLSRVTMPVRFIGGEDDVLQPLAVLELACKLFPNASLIEVPQCGHSMYFEKPDVFNFLVHRFLKDCGIGGPAD